MNTYHINLLEERPASGVRQVMGSVPCVATVGFFDGVHLGHQFVVSQLCRLAQANGLQTAVVTFDNHPRQVLDPTWQPQLLTPIDEKCEELSRLGIDHLFVMHFDSQTAQLPARDFMLQLQRKVGVRMLLTGYDNRFGRRSTVTQPDGTVREEGFDDYVGYGRQLGIQVVRSQSFEVSGIHVSSSVIRRLITAGEVYKAYKCLGHPYFLYGRVVEGHQIGRQLGYPTANVRLSSPSKLVPAQGVYGVRCKIDGSRELLPGMMNIGLRPTFHGTGRTIEVYLFDYKGNLYGQGLGIAVMFYHRSEQKFDTPEALVRQLQQDAADIKSTLQPVKTVKPC